jgi:hypothetical protein
MCLLTHHLDLQSIQVHLPNSWPGIMKQLSTPDLEDVLSKSEVTNLAGDFWCHEQQFNWSTTPRMECFII